MKKDIREIRAEFPLLEKVAWLASAGVGPLARPALLAMRETATRLYEEHDPAAWEEEPHEDSRRLLADYLGIEENEIALTRSTTEGLNAVAGAIPWKQGDGIVITDQEYPANVIPWYHQAHRHGLRVNVVQSQGGRLPPVQFAAAIDARTRVVAVSHVQFASGFRADLPALAELAHSVGAWLIVDGIQSVGAIRVQPRELGVDALACGGYKWLCGPIGTGFLYVRRELAEELTPATLGYETLGMEEYQAIWDSLCGGGRWVRDFSTMAAGARRFDGTGLSPVLFSGFAATMRHFLELGPDWIEKRVLDLSGKLIAQLKVRGYIVVTPDNPMERAGIVLFRGPWDLGSAEARAAIEEKLQAAGVKVSIRAGGIRVSCHFFNTEDELEKLLATLKSS